MLGKIDDDFDLESALSDSSQIDEFFTDSASRELSLQNERITKKDSTSQKTEKSIKDSDFEFTEYLPEEKKTEEERKRTSKDFELNMDAILLTAQSAMIIEGIKCYSAKDFSPATLPIYIEALKGIDLYIKIIDRNPTNYHKLKTIIDTDIDCQRVENTVFNLFKKLFGRMPDNDSEKIVAFEKFRQLFENAKNKATISSSSKMIKKYFLLSGGIDKEKIAKLVQSKNLELINDINAITSHITLAIEMVKTGNFEIVQGLRGKDLNAFIINASELLSYYFNLVGNIQAAAHYERIHSNFKKYFITK